MELPKIGDRIDVELGLELCKYYKLDYLVSRITQNKEAYISWDFDGCSGIHDKFLGLLTRCDSDDLTYKCCLPHDLGYAYGEPGNRIERKRVDVKFQSDLITKARMADWAAAAMYEAVRVGGAEIFGLSFSWAFARK